MKVRTRFAPSPTGFVHIGGIRTALYSYALAKKYNGQFVLRIEDTDKKREVEGGTENIVKMLEILGLDFDEGPVKNGPHAPYIQSQRLEIYKKKAEELVESGHAYYCFCSSERLEDLRKERLEAKLQPMYDKKCRDIPLDEAKKRIEKGEKYVIRLKVPENETLSIQDQVMGHVEWNSNDVDDQVLLKSDGYPTYHLGVVVDDVLMEITHITRGIEWLASVPKHILLYKAFNYEMPVMAHMPVILDPDGGKLSKRKGTVATEEFLKHGYLPEAILNFLMLLGWSAPVERVHGEKEIEFFSLADFVEMFDLKDLNKSSPVFNREKLLWFNHKYIANLSADLFVVKFSNWLGEYAEDKDDLEKKIVEKGPDYLQKALNLVQPKAKLLSEIPEMIEPFYYFEGKVDFKQAKQTQKLDKKQIDTIIQNFKTELSLQKSVDAWGHEKWEAHVRETAEKLEIGAGKAFMVLRIAILGNPISPPLFESMQVLGKDEVMRRLNE